MKILRFLGAFTILIFSLSRLSFAIRVVNLWHAYRAEEKNAIEYVANMFNVAYMSKGIKVNLLAVPFDAMNDKLRAQIPLGQGPDVFIFAQDYVGLWAEKGIINPLEYYFTPEERAQFFENTLKAFQYEYPESMWGVPMSFKNLVLFYNKAYIKTPPNKVSELIEIGRKFTNPSVQPYGRWGLLYEVGNFYYHTMWIQGFGGKIFERVGKNYYQPLLDSKQVVDGTYYMLTTVLASGIVRIDADRTLITDLFNNGNAMFVINGQWFRGEIKNIDYGVAPLPIIDPVGRRAIPFLTVEGMFMASCVRDVEAAVEVIKFFTSPQALRYMAKIGKQTPANIGAYQYSEVKHDPIAQIFSEAAKEAVPMPNVPEMALTWSPATAGLGECIGAWMQNKSITPEQIKAIWTKYQKKLVKDIENFRKGQ